MPIKPELMEILACPDCRSSLVERQETLICTNADCRRKYAIHQDIPVMLVEESEVLHPETWEPLVSQQ
jgi:uncharacterized protein YbaR (Trm112 family)